MFIKNLCLLIGMKMKRRKMNKKGMLGQIIGAFIILLVGITLFFPIYDSVTKAQAQVSINQDNYNITGNSFPITPSTMLGIIPAFFALSIIVIVIMVVTTTLRSAGFGSSDNNNNDYEEYKDVIKPKRVKKHKQTYMEFVQERLAVERMMRKQDGFFWWLRR